MAAALLVHSPAAGAAVRAELSATAIQAGDDVQLMLERTGQTDAQPDLSPLNRDFDVLASSRSSQMQIINGRASSSTALMLTLSPKHAGHLTVPSISWGGEQSAPLALDVSGGASAGAAAGTPNGSGAAGGSAGAAGAAGQTPGTAGASRVGGRVFLQTLVEPKQPYVQAAVQVTVRLYAAEPLYHPDLSLQPGGNVLVQQVGADEQGTATLQGRSYAVVTRHYVLFPQASGTLRLTGAVLDAQVAAPSSAFGNDPFARFFGNNNFFGGSPFGGLVTATQPIRVHGDPIVLSVKPRPNAATGRYWLPAQQLLLTSQWSPAPLRVKAGDPITVQLHLRAEGLTAAQLPDLSSLWKLPAGLKAYPDQAKLHDSAQGHTLVGERDQSIALISDQPGTFAIPALLVRWWDTTSNSPRAATLPARTVEILPAPAAPGSTAGAASALGTGSLAGPPPPGAAVVPAPSVRAAPVSRAIRRSASLAPRWRDAALALAVLWLATIAAWWLSARRQRHARHSAAAREPGTSAGKARPTAGQARSAFESACRRDDAAGARGALLVWASHLSGEPITGLQALGARLAREEVDLRLRELDRACSLGEPWQGGALAGTLADLPAWLAARDVGRKRSSLAPLYPS